MMIASLVCAILMTQPVKTGLDELIASGYACLQGKSVAVLTNHSALDAQGRHLITHLVRQDAFRIKAFLAPEHGFKGILDEERIPDHIDPGTQLPVYSLYGEHKRPTAEMLAGVDVLLFDIQDIGTRFYTYQTTLLHALEACAELGVEVIVLDRPNPLGGVRCEGPLLDADKFSFVGAFPMPVIHGMTMGELAEMFRAERHLEVKLTVIPCTQWQRDMLFDQTGLVWINPSPNMRSLTQAILYPAVGMLEYTNISVGRGTDTPFERLGAPWIEPVSCARALNAAQLPGVTFVPFFFTPVSGPYQGERCGGIQIFLLDRVTFDPIRTAYTIFTHLEKTYPKTFDGAPLLRLLGNQVSFDALRAGQPIAQILAAERQRLSAFLEIRKKYLIYP